jgi:hypothetical protein
MITRPSDRRDVPIKRALSEMSMTTLRFPVAVTLQRTVLANRWQSERWAPYAVEVEAATSTAVRLKVGDDASGVRWRFGGLHVELHPSEAEGYHLNITAPEPKVFVMWRAAEADVEPGAYPVVVTVSYNQAARMLDGGEQVDSLPLSAEMLAWMQPFVAAHYKPEPRTKVRRNDPLGEKGRRRGGGSEG